MIVSERCCKNIIIEKILFGLPRGICLGVWERHLLNAWAKIMSPIKTICRGVFFLIRKRKSTFRQEEQFMRPRQREQKRLICGPQGETQMSRNYPNTGLTLTEWSCGGGGGYSCRGTRDCMWGALSNKKILTTRPTPSPPRGNVSPLYYQINCIKLTPSVSVPLPFQSSLSHLAQILTSS